MNKCNKCKGAGGANMFCNNGSKQYTIEWHGCDFCNSTGQVTDSQLLNEKTGIKLRKLMHEKNFSMREISQKLGISAADFCKLTGGYRNIEIIEKAIKTISEYQANALTKEDIKVGEGIKRLFEKVDYIKAKTIK